QIPSTWRRITVRAESSPKRQRKTRAPATCRCIMMRPIPARFNFRCDDGARSWNFGPHAHVFAIWGTGGRRYGNGDRDPLLAGGRKQPFASLFVSRRRKTFAAINK